MTTHQKSGEMDKPTNLKEAGLQELEGWEVSNLQGQSDPLVDKGTGKTIVIRLFEFKKHPNFTEISQQELFNVHSRQIATLLWADGLTPLDSVSPRVIMGKDDYKIFVPCEAKTGTTFADKPMNLTQALTGNSKPSESAS